MKTYHQLFTLVLLILVVLTAIFIVRIELTILGDNVINKVPSDNIHSNKNLPAKSLNEYLINNPFLHF
jgi:hypothetical protein